jgi:hypothetical protein
MAVSLHEVMGAVLPLKVTKLDPSYCPKPEPAIVTVVPIWPAIGETVAMTGIGTVKGTALLATPFTVTTMFPEVAKYGTLT